jgi:transposase
MLSLTETPAMTEYFIALDVHCAFSEMAVVTGKGKHVRSDRCATAIPALVERIEAVARPRRLTFEEGPMADWLARSLRSHVDELVVCEPRRNHWIARDGDKDDPIDAGKLANLYRGGYLKAVHQSESLQRSLLKQQVSMYHDRVAERVRQGNQLGALFRRHGAFVKPSDLVAEDEWQLCLRRLPQNRILRDGVERVREVYLLMLEQEEALRGELVGLAKNEEPVRRFVDLPGFSWIRAVTFYAYIDTPWRFRSKSALWRYTGIGLERRHSGQGPTRTRLSKQGHRQLKNVLLGAAKTAISQAQNPFADKFKFWNEQEGLVVSNARRNVARALAAAMWSMWKTGQRYDPQRVTVPCGEKNSDG